MDYVKVHHLWQPLAAISTREVNHHLPIDYYSRTTTSNNAMISNTTAAITSFLSAITAATTTSSASIDYDNTVVLNEMQLSDEQNYTFNGSNGTLDENFDLYSINSLDQYYNNYTNLSNVIEEQTWELITMIGTAVALGLLILATVIGE